MNDRQHRMINALARNHRLAVSVGDLADTSFLDLKQRGLVRIDYWIGSVLMCELTAEGRAYAQRHCAAWDPDDPAFKTYGPNSP